MIGSLVALFWFSALFATAQAEGGNWQVPGEIRKPSDKPWQVPGEIQKPGEIQVPGDIQKAGKPDGCQVTLTAYADALFEFDKSTLNDKAETPLTQALESIRSEKGIKQLRVRGHTDAKGSDAYNDRLSQARAEAVRGWLQSNEASLPPMTTEAVGEREPLKPNSNPDGSDNPEGRAYNRRVEIVLELCKPTP
jgi:outer membrane protein OmpA-like peptidoglycan-associated protein